MTLPRPCLVCGAVTAAGSYCSTHARQRQRNRDVTRGSTGERGYGAEHRRERAKWAKIVANGQATCCRCGLPIEGGAFDLDHTAARDAYRGVSHSRCNRSAGAR